MGVGVLGEQLGFEERDAVEAPGGVGDFVDELSLGGGGGLVLIEKLLDVALVGVGVLGGQDGGAGGEAMAEGVERGALLARFGARAGGVRRVGAVDGDATLLANFERGPLLLVLLELGLRLPFVHLGDWITRPEMQLIEGRHSLLKGK